VVTKARAVAAVPPGGPTGSLWGGLSDGDLVVVDTAPLIYVLEDHVQFAPLFIGLFEACERAQLRIAVTTISLAEVLVGPFKRGQEALAKRYEKAIGGFELAALTPERLRVFHPCPPCTPKHPGSSLQMRAIARAMAVLCA